MTFLERRNAGSYPPYHPGSAGHEGLRGCLNGKPGTKAEIAALRAATTFCAGEGLPFAKDLETLLAKLTTPFKPRAEGPDMLHVQELLVFYSMGHVIPVEGTNTAWWSSLGMRSAGRGITDEDTILVAKWLGRQPWAENMTVDRVMAGWPSYLARAKADTRGTPEVVKARRDWDATE